jgi:hypothetical protein
MGRERKGKMDKGGKKPGLSLQGLPKIYPPNGQPISKELRAWAERKIAANKAAGKR